MLLLLELSNYMIHSTSTPWEIQEVSISFINFIKVLPRRMIRLVLTRELRKQLESQSKLVKTLSNKPVRLRMLVSNLSNSLKRP